MEVHLKANGNISDMHRIGFHFSLNYVSGQQTLCFFASFLWNLIGSALYIHHKHVRMNPWLDLCLNSGIWWVFRVWEPVLHYLDRGEAPVFWVKGEKTWPRSKQKHSAGFRSRQRGWGFGQDGGIKNGQSRLTSRYVLVLPLGQTASELLSQQSLARWRTESCPGASGWRSEERESERRHEKQTDRWDWHNTSILLVFLYNRANLPT